MQGKIVLAKPNEFGAACQDKVKESSSESRWRLLFRFKDNMPAVVEHTGTIDYFGNINPQAKECIVSFPGKYQSGWEALINEDASDSQSVACVFFCTPEKGLGRHSRNPDAPNDVCYCPRIYGKKDYKQLGYLKRLPPETDLAKEAEEKRKAEHTKAVVIREDANVEEIRKAERLAREACENNGNRASWGCAWFEKWKENVHKAMDYNQQLKVEGVFFLSFF